MPHIVNAIDEWIVAGVRHGEPVTAEVNNVNVTIFIDAGPGDIKHIVRLEGQPR